MVKRIITTNETGPIKEKHTILERLFNQRYILEAQGFIFKNQYDLTQYTIPPSYEDESWKKVNESFQQVGYRANDAAKAMSKLVEVWQDANKRRDSKM
jgi:hypothetical protein